jgi:hypothetical protein
MCACARACTSACVRVCDSFCLNEFCFGCACGFAHVSHPIAHSWLLEIPRSGGSLSYRCTHNPPWKREKELHPGVDRGAAAAHSYFVNDFGLPCRAWSEHGCRTPSSLGCAHPQSWGCGARSRGGRDWGRCVVHHGARCGGRSTAVGPSSPRSVAPLHIYGRPCATEMRQYKLELRALVCTCVHVAAPVRGSVFA